MIAQQRLERAETGHLVEQILDQGLALLAIERQLRLGEHAGQDQTQLVAQLGARQLLDGAEIQLLDQLAVPAVLERLIARDRRAEVGERRRGRARGWAGRTRELAALQSITQSHWPPSFHQTDRPRTNAAPPARPCPRVTSVAP